MLFRSEWLSDVSIYDDNDKINAFNMTGVLAYDDPVLLDLRAPVLICLKTMKNVVGFSRRSLTNWNQ